MEKVKRKQVYRGEIYFADLSPVKGSEQGGVRPVIVIQNDKGNKFSPTTIVAIITTRTTKAKLPTHYWIEGHCLPKHSMVELEQIKTIDKSRLKNYLGCVTVKEMQEIDKKIKISLGLDNQPQIER